MDISKQNVLPSNVITLARTIETYKQSVDKEFSFLKQTARLDDLFAKSIPLRDGEGFLVPICELHYTDEELIAKLSQWRTENAFAYPTQFPVTCFLQELFPQSCKLFFHSVASPISIMLQPMFPHLIQQGNIDLQT